MDIKEFVQQSLSQIINGADLASNEKYRFELDSTVNKGVKFNLALINAESKTNKSKAGAGIGIKIVNADYGNEKNKITSSENISRIEFNIKHRDLVAEARFEQEAARANDYIDIT